MKSRRLVYPFVPKSAGWLIPGQFWALPLSNGTFACGRVIEVPAPEHCASRMEFLAGVLDWHGVAEPDSASIAGAPCLAQGRAHIRAITRSGGVVLGFRELVADRIEPWLFRGAHHHVGSSVLRGCTPVRPQAPSDSELPVLGVWGYGVAVHIAEARFVKRTVV